MLRALDKQSFLSINIIQLVFQERVGLELVADLCPIAPVRLCTYP